MKERNHMYYELMILGLVIVTVPYITKLAGYSVGDKSTYLVGISGIFFLVSAAIGVGTTVVTAFGDFAPALMQISAGIGIIGMIFAAIFGMFHVIRGVLVP
ncbi:MAG: hypothetical protein AAF558_06680 [Verrucomicrobiota bacterium]